MSNFYCEHCGAEIVDSPTGYVTECEHWPMENLHLKEHGPQRGPSSLRQVEAQRIAVLRDMQNRLNLPREMVDPDDGQNQ